MNLPSPLLNIIKRVMGKPTYPNYLPEFQEIHNLVLQGKYKEGLKKLQQRKKALSNMYQGDELQVYKLFVDFMEIDIKTKQGQAAELLLQVKQLQATSDKLENPVLSILSILEVSNVLFVSGEDDAALDYLIPLMTSVVKLKFYYPTFYWQYLARIHHLLGKIYQKKANLQDAVENLLNCIHIHSQQDNTEDLAEPYFDIGIIYASTGAQELALDYLIKSKQVYMELGDTVQLLKIFNNTGLIRRNIGDLSDALADFEQALKLSLDQDDQQKTAVIKNNIGQIYQDMGDLTLAEQYMMEALNIFETHDNRPATATSYLTLANVVTMKGDLDRALDYMNTSLKINTELEDKKSIAELYTNIGKIYTQRGDIDQAIQYTESGLEIFENIGERGLLPQVVYSLVQLHARLGNKDAYNKYLKLLDELRNEFDTKFSHLMYKLGEAEILKQSERVVKRAEAQKILYELVDDKDLTLIHQQESMMSLAQLLLQELKLSPSEEALSEFKDIIERLYESIQDPEKHSVDQLPIQVQILLLRAKLGLLDMDMELAESLLDDAIEIANKYGFESLHHQATAEKDGIKDQMLKYKKMVDTNASILDRLKQTQIEDYLKKAENILRS